MQQRPRIIGWQRSGAPIWSMAGASPDDPNSDGTSGDGGSGTGSGTSGSGGGTGENGGTENGDGEKVTLSKAEHQDLLDRLENLDTRMKAADRRASDAEGKLQARENEGKPELDRVKAERDAAVEERDKIHKQLREVSIKLAFATVPGLTWHDPNVAAKLLMSDLPDDVVSKDGTVDSKAVERAAKDLASKHKYLVKSESGGEGGDGKGDGKNGKEGGSGSGSGGSGSGTPSGSNVGSSGNGAGDNQTARRAELARRAPSLGGRGR